MVFSVDWVPNCEDWIVAPYIVTPSCDSRGKRRRGWVLRVGYLWISLTRREA